MKNNIKNNFIENIIEKDLNNKKIKQLFFRFPPEPNGCLHLGHVKAICLNFNLSLKYNGKIYLRFDNTNPENISKYYIESIKNDIIWLGFKWHYTTYTSDYFNQLYNFAIILIKKGLAYVDDSNQEEVIKMRGTPNSAGIESKYRNRTIEDNLKLFDNMKNGLYKENSRVLRAKIDMNHYNMHMRDPIMYRIRYNNINSWFIYPTYDFAHGQCDSIEKINYSICTLEFIDHKLIYNWFIKSLNLFPSKQFEFARLNVTYNIMSKRKILLLIKNKKISNWDDPRLLTIGGLRNKGVSPQAIRNFINHIGIQKRDNIIDIELLDFFICKELNIMTDRIISIINPLKVVITNYSNDANNKILFSEKSKNKYYKDRNIVFSKIIYIERSDFSENPSKEFKRLYINNIVKLQYSYAIKCNKIIKNNNNVIEEIHCSYIKNSNTISYKNKNNINIIHWIDANNMTKAHVILYDNLFLIKNPEKQNNFMDFFNPKSIIEKEIFIENIITKYKIGDKLQFVRNGYFIVKYISKDNKYVLSRISKLKSKL